jgi:hypothetical protein
MDEFRTYPVVEPRKDGSYHAEDFKKEVLRILDRATEPQSATDLRGWFDYKLDVPYNLYDKLRKAANMLVAEKKVILGRGKYRLKGRSRK